MTDADHGARSTARSPALAGAIGVMVLVLLVLAAATTGSWDRRPVGEQTVDTGPRSTAPTMPTPSMSDPPSLPPMEPGQGGQSGLTWVLLGLAVLVGLALLMLVLRHLLALSRRPPEADPTARAADLATVDEIDAPEMLEGISRAQRILDSERPPRDAIVQAWLALEHAAERAGVARRPSQTPTEFTSVVLERTAADAAAVEVLRRLYLHVRFSDGAVTDADGEAARAALHAIAQSWSAVTADS